MVVSFAAYSALTPPVSAAATLTPPNRKPQSAKINFNNRRVRAVGCKRWLGGILGVNDASSE
jgi:hypothetical protein